MSSENEQKVPLNSEENKEEEVPKPPTEDAPAEVKPKKNWFTWGKKKAPATEDVEMGGESEEKKPEKKCWWARNKCAQDKNEMSIGVDLVNRDEKQINNHVQMDFSDVYGESDSQHSWDFVWRWNHAAFRFIRFFVYRLLSLAALPFTILFGVLFGIVASINVFLVVPLVKLLAIPANGAASIWKWAVNAVVAPIASAVGLVFSSFSIRKYGFNQEATQPCV